VALSEREAHQSPIRKRQSDTSSIDGGLRCAQLHPTHIDTRSYSALPHRITLQIKRAPKRKKTTPKGGFYVLRKPGKPGFPRQRGQAARAD